MHKRMEHNNSIAHYRQRAKDTCWGKLMKVFDELCYLKRDTYVINEIFTQKKLFEENGRKGRRDFE